MFQDREELVRDSVRRSGAEGSKSRGIDIGARIGAIRRERKLSLQDMSGLTGVSASAISKIERNDLSPTISTVQRIALGLGLELVALLTGQEAEAASVPGRRSVTRAGRGNRHTTRTCENALLCADLKNKLVTPILTTVRARSVDDYEAWSRSDADIFVTVIEGTLVVHSSIYEPLVLETGDSLYYSAETEHAWTSSGPDDAVVLWILASKGGAG